MCHDRLTAPVRGGAGIFEEERSFASGGTAIPLYVARPEGAEGPGIVIIHDVYGANPFYQDLARRLAGEGFVAALPDLFIRQGAIPDRDREAAQARAKRLDQRQALADIAAAQEWLRPHTRNGLVGVVGFCMGGTLAMLSAAREPAPAAVVSFYGFPTGSRYAETPLRPLDEVDQVCSPLLLIWGGKDTGVGRENAEAYARALEERGKPVESVLYEEQGHGFLTFDPSSPDFAASEDAFAKMAAFFAGKLDA